MELVKFKKNKEIIKAGWPVDHVIEEREDKLVLQCDNGTFIIYRFIKPQGIPEMDTMMANKVMFQFTEDLKAPQYYNASAEFIGKREPRKGSKLEGALKELSMRVQVGAALS